MLIAAGGCKGQRRGEAVGRTSATKETADGQSVPLPHIKLHEEAVVGAGHGGSDYAHTIARAGHLGLSTPCYGMRCVCVCVCDVLQGALALLV